MSTSTPVHYGRLVWVTILTAVVVGILNALVFLIASSIGAFPETVLVPQANMPISLPPVVFTSLIGVMGASLTYALISRFAQNPVRLFRRIALLVLVLSFITPFSIPNAPMGFYLALELMHLIVGVVTIWSLTTYVIPE